MRRYVYRGPAEPPARATASGDAHIVPALRGLGVVTPAPWITDRGPMPCPAWGCDGPPGVRNWFGPPNGPGNGMGPVRWFGPPPYGWWNPGSGATSAVPQPPPGTGVTLTVPNPYAPNPVPAPSPTVPVDPSQTAPTLTQPGQTLAQSTGTPWDIGTWLGENTIFSSVPNWMVASGGILALLMFMKGGRR